MAIWISISILVFTALELLFNPIVEYQYDIDSIVNTWTRWICMIQKQFDLMC